MKKCSAQKIALIRVVEQTLPKANVTKVDKGEMDEIMEECAFAKTNSLFTGENGKEVWQQLGIFSGFFIYPGTKWCGAGNISSGYDDLGPESDTDLCCREHDHCEDNMEGYESKYSLENSSPFTKSHCDCDEEFRQCLAKADTRTSHRVGRIYFNLLMVECFRQDHPTKGCTKYRGWFRRRCLEYEFDCERDVEWQFFDAQHYDAPTEEEDNNEGTGQDNNEEEDNNEVEDGPGGDVFQYMDILANLNEEKYHSYKES